MQPTATPPPATRWPALALEAARRARTPADWRRVADLAVRAAAAVEAVRQDLTPRGGSIPGDRATAGAGPHNPGP